MSKWTRVVGAVVVNAPGDSQHACRFVVDGVLAHLPKVTGSERDMGVYVTQQEGRDVSSSIDEFGDWVETEWQSTYVISLYGALRDRTFDETLRELSAFLCRLAKRLDVWDISVTVSGDTEEYAHKSHTFDDYLPFYYRECQENPWRNKLKEALR